MLRAMRPSRDGTGARLPRASLAFVALVHALVFGAAAALLPWPTFTMFSLLAGLLSAAHLATALSAAAGLRVLDRVWRGASLLSLGFFAYFAYASLGSGLYVNQLYEGVGTAILAASIAAFSVGVLFTVPLACWGIAATGGLFRSQTNRDAEHRAFLSAGVLVLAGFGVASDANEARGDRPFSVPANGGLATLGPLSSLRPRAPSEPAPQAFLSAPISCARAPSSFEGATLILTYFGPGPDAPDLRSLCLQARDLQSAVMDAQKELERAWDRGDVTVDVIVRVRPIPDVGPLLGAVIVRPGVEGVCEQDRCLTPWQLFGTDAFTEATNVAALQAELGVTADALRRRLATSTGSFAGLDAIETRTFWLRTDGRIEPVRHLRTGARPLNARELRASLADAVGYIAANQEPDGAFRYTVDPFTGSVSNAGFSVPRQAGTTLALCEVARDVRAARAPAQKSADMLAALEQANGDRGGIIFPKGSKKRAALGPTALTDIALLACRDQTGKKHDDTIVRLSTMLLALQRPDGGFSPSWDPATNQVFAGKDPLYAAGQAVLALVLWEKSTLPKPPGLKDAIDLAMAYYAGPYWDIPLRDFFYLEENWHCLAAREALTSHRNDSYERFCVDYMTMKSRFIQRPASGVDEDLVGSYAFGHVFPPHHTATSGFGEALAAVITIKQARGLSTERDEETMRYVLAYLLRHQWRADNCSMCSQKVRVAGAFSEHVASPLIRIDFVQHALAALNHGGHVTGILQPRE